MTITKMAMLVAVVVGLLAMVQQSVQMSDDASSMLRETGNDKLSSSAIVFSEKASETAILESGDFVLTGTEVIAERVFRTGTIVASSPFSVGLSPHPVVLVDTGKYSANVSSALQIAFSRYRIHRVLYLGLAGDLTGGNRLKFGDVLIPTCLAFTALWDWLSPNANPEGDLVFGNFNQGENVQNALGSAKFNNVTVCADEHFLKKASVVKVQFPDFKLRVVELGASSDMKIYNEAYAEFLHKRFGFEAVDQDSVTVALVSKLNKMWYMVFQGVSYIAASGVPPTGEEEQKAAENAYLALKAMLDSLEYEYADV